MKNIIDYLKENKTYEHDALGRDFTLMLSGDNVVLTYNGYDWLIKADNYAEGEIQGILEDYKIEIRFCEECGKPIDMGFIADGGFWYCCEDCFEEAMDKCYGKGKWRGTEYEGEYGGFYECLKDNGEWEDTSIFYTEWY